ncbi:MAG: hypothetical protein D6820_11850 [Lentisphaerae bacterium]|nr:MAG: hypothetical protein D6820_11850 [Lentisphaerota bacterium]
MKKQHPIRRRKGQTLVEYVLIVCVVVVATVGILSLFSDTVREKIAGVVKTFDPDADVDSELKGSKQIMQDLDKEGLDGGN